MFDLTGSVPDVPTHAAPDALLSPTSRTQEPLIMKPGRSALLLLIALSLVSGFAPSLFAQSQLDVCGTVVSYVAATPVTTGALTIDTTVVSIAAGATISNGALLQSGANVCVNGTTDALGVLTSASVSANVTTTLQLCGPITAYSAATSTADGALTIGGEQLVIASGALLDGGGLLAVGADVCLNATINGLGEVTAPSTITANITSTVALCGVVGAYTASTSTTLGSLQIGGQTLPIAIGAAIANQHLLTTGADVCLNATINALGQITVPSSVTANTTTTLDICGVVTAYVPATTTAPGSITIGGQTFPIAIGTAIGNATLITSGANLCLEGSLNGFGQVTTPSSVTANATTTLSVCGLVTAYTPATLTTAGSITIGGQTLPIAAGTTIDNASSILTGADLCLAATLNALGQVVVPSSVTANVTTTLALCGVVENYTPATTTADGSITIAGRTFPIAAGTSIANSSLISAGADLCMTATLNALGEIIVPTSVTANVKTAVEICGVVTAYTPATSNANGLITIGGQTFPIAAGTSITNSEAITLGANLCLKGTTNAFGEIIVPSSVSAGVTTTVTLCGVVSAYTPATTTADGSITIGGQTFPIGAGTVIGNASEIKVGAEICLSATIDGGGEIVPPTVVTDAADLSLLKSASTTTVAVGDQFTYTLAVGNGGPSAATNVAVSDTLPGQVTLISVSSTQGSCSGTTTLTCNLGTIAAGSGATVSITVRANAPGSATNTATVTSPTPDPNSGNNTSAVTTTITDDDPAAAADLSVLKTASAATVSVGDQLTYTIAVSNAGPAAATGVTVIDSLPGSVTFVSASATQGSCTGTTTVSCNLGTIASAAGATVTITVRGATPGTAVNEATVSATTPDPNTGNNTSTVTTTINGSTAPQSDMSLAKSSSAATVSVGDQFTYTLAVSNAGPATANDVVVTDPLPSSVTFVSASASQGSCTGTTTVSCNLGTIATGAGATVSIVVRAITAGTARNEASVSSSSPDPDPADNNSHVDTEILGGSSGEQADVSVAKSVSTASVRVGETFTYTVTATNGGPAAATSVSVTDTLPAIVTFVSAQPSTGSCSGTTTVACSFGTLAPNGSASVTITVRATAAGTATNAATVSSSLPDPVPGNNTTPPVVTVIENDPSPDPPSVDLSMTKTASPSRIRLGGTLSYRLTIGNAGPDTAEGVVVTDALPHATTLVSVAASQGTCSGDRTIVCSLGALAAGGVATIDLVVTVTETPESQVVVNTAVVTSTTPERNPPDNIHSVVSPFDPQQPTPRDVIVTNTVCPSSVCLGTAFTYTITVKNSERTPTEEVIITSDLSQVRLVSATPTQGECSGGTVLTCRLGRLEAGATATINVTVIPRHSGRVQTQVRVVQPATVGAGVSMMETTVDDCPRGFDVYIPVAGRVTGGGGAAWDTALRIHNWTTEPITVTAEWFPMSASGHARAARTETLTVAPGEHDLHYLIDAFTGGSGLGSIRFTSSAPFGAAARVFNTRQGERGTVGDLTLGKTIADATDRGVLMQLSTGPLSPTSFRTNLGYLNPWPETVLVTFRASTPDGRLLGTKTVALPPMANAQVPLHDLIDTIPAGDRIHENLNVTFQAAAPLFVFGSLVDEHSTDTNMMDPWPTE
jgi:uncharacterized repeat protein (TIGR01451 family)